MMTPEIQAIAAACEWFPSYFLLISENVFSPLLYYSYFGSIIPSILIALFVFFKGPNKLTNRLLLLTILSFTAWTFCNLVTWATEYPSHTMFAWSLLVLFEPLVYFFAFYFFHVFVFQKDFSLLQKIIFSVPLLVTFILTPTSFSLLGYDLSNCDRNAVEGIVATYGYAIEIIYAILILGFALYFIRKTKDVMERRKTTLLTFGIIAFLLSLSAGNILEVFTENWYVGQYGLFGAPIFVAFLAYIMVKYKTFNTKIFGAQALVMAIGLLVTSMFFVRSIENIRFVLVGTLLLLIPFGYYLIQSVKREIEAKEREQSLRQEVEGLAKNLEKSNSQMEAANKELEKLNARLKELDKAKDEFLSIATHQLKAPLSSIRGAAANILDESFGKVSAKLKEPIENVMRVATGMVTLIDDYLNVSRIEQGRMKYELSDFNLTEIVKMAAEGQLAPAKKKGLDLTFTGSTALFVNADIGKITQVINNLVDNAVKYTPKGFVKVTVDTFEKEGKEFVRAMVSDSGIGIDPSEIGKLFQRFSRATDANKTNTQGTGLGLYVAKQLTEGCGGVIRIESEGLGKGSQFIVEFPIVVPGAKAKTPEAPTPKT